MPSNKPRFTFRTEQEILDKLHFIAQEEHRTDTNMLEYILLRYIKEYEYENGIIELEEI